MIVKNNEIFKFKSKNYFLFYGKNEGLKSETITNLIKDNEDIFYYDEKEILENENGFIESNLSNSLFENKKIIIIKRGTDKILSLIKEISEKNIGDNTIIINSENLDKKSKLRSYFEKDKKFICVPFYPDNEYTLLKLANKLLIEEKIKLSSEDINFIIRRSNGDRGNLKNNIDKLIFFLKNGKKIKHDYLSKLMNSTEEENISTLIDNCLAKNQNKTIVILNENNFTNEDCIIMTRTLLQKLKKLLNLCELYERNKNIDLTISSSRPPIFWKDKEIVKKQILSWSPNNLKKTMYKTNELELELKKNFNNPKNLIIDFLINNSSKKLIV